jgi:hypothetical protein
MTAPAYGETTKETTTDTRTEPALKNPYSRGTAKKVIGIVMIPASVAVGAVIALIPSLNYCTQSYEKTHQAQCAREDKERQTMLFAGAAVIAGGVTGGILLLNSGRSDGRQWKEWEAEHGAGQSSPTKDERSYIPNVTPWVARGKGGLTLTWVI